MKNNFHLHPFLTFAPVNLIRLIFISGIFLCLGSYTFGQDRYKSKNLPGFDDRYYHFGFLLGYNSADLFLERKNDTTFTDSLISLDVGRQPGFNIGIIGSFNFTKNLSIRFVPQLSFQDRVLEYVFLQKNGKPISYVKRLEATNIDFPLHLKFRSDRINNFAVYALAGGKFSMDMQSREEVKNNVADEIVVKLIRNDYSVEFGGGFDFFLTYFKFGIELKMSMGLPNQIIRDDTIFSNPIDRIRTKAFFVTLTFEG